jgi:hypothetical protein
MRPDIASAALQFLQRVQLAPQEIQAFIAVETALKQASQAEVTPEVNDADSSEHPNKARLVGA